MPSLRIANLREPKTLLSILLQLSILLLSVAYPLMYPKKTSASLTTGYVRFDRQSINQTLAGVVCMRSSQTAPGVAKVIVQFPSTVNFNGAGDTTWTDDTTASNLPAGATAWPVTGNSLKLPSATTSAVFLVGDLANSANTYCFHFSGATPSSTTGTSNTAGTGQVIAYKSDGAGGTIVEQFAYGTQFLGTSGSANEQIVITATVSGQLTFSLSAGAGATATAGASIPLGVLSASQVIIAPYTVTATVTTNARNGYLTWVKGTNGSLHSDSSGDNIWSPGAYGSGPNDISGASGGYGLYASGGGTNTPTIVTEYNTTGVGNFAGHIDASQFYQLSSYTSPTTSSTTTIGVKAKPTSTTKAATDYNDSLIVVASGSF